VGLKHLARVKLYSNPKYLERRWESANPIEVKGRLQCLHNLTIPFVKIMLTCSFIYIIANSSHRYYTGQTQWNTQYVFGYGVVQTRHENFNHSDAIQVSRKLANFFYPYTYIIIYLSSILNIQ
jgi:hypothetical protein